MHEIRFCREEETDKIKEFINGNWKAGHILGSNTTLLDWQHLDRVNKKYNFIVADNRATGAFDAILGYVATSHFDPLLLREKDVWLTTWMNDRNKSHKPGLGRELLAYLEQELAPHSIGLIATSKASLAVCKALKYKTGTLAHYYFLRTDILDFKIAITDKAVQSDRENNATVLLKELKDLKEADEVRCDFRPKKSIEYLSRRFCNHPVYKYRFYGLYLKDKPSAIFVVRKVSANGGSCLRIVDIFGRIHEGYLGAEFEKLLAEECAEYIDCLNYGIDENIFSSMGFLKKTGLTIIPNYFEPFERRNVDIEFAYRAEYKNYIIFKADSDQDRPNR